MKILQFPHILPDFSLSMQYKSKHSSPNIYKSQVMISFIYQQKDTQCTHAMQKMLTSITVAIQVNVKGRDHVIPLCCVWSHQIKFRHKCLDATRNAVFGWASDFLCLVWGGWGRYPRLAAFATTGLGVTAAAGILIFQAIFFLIIFFGLYRRQKNYKYDLWEMKITHYTWTKCRQHTCYKWTSFYIFFSFTYCNL